MVSLLGLQSFLFVFRKGEYVNLACSIICLVLESSSSFPKTYSLLLIFSDDDADIFAASLSISFFTNTI